MEEIMKFDKKSLESMTKAQLIIHIFELYQAVENYEESKTPSKKKVYTYGAPKWVQEVIADNIRLAKEGEKNG